MRIIQICLLSAAGQHRQALALVEARLASTPTDPALLAIAARSAFHCREWRSCIEWAGRWHKHHKRAAEPLLLKLAACWLMGERDEAQNTINTVNSLGDPILSAVCQQLQWYMEGRHCFSLHVAPTQVSQLRAFHRWTLQVLRLAVISGDIGLLGKLLPILRPEEDLDAWLQLGLYYYQYGHPQLAWLELRDCERRGKAIFQSLRVLGELALERRELALAIDYLQRALTRKPAHREIRLLLARAYQLRAEQLLAETRQSQPEVKMGRPCSKFD